MRVASPGKGLQQIYPFLKPREPQLGSHTSGLTDPSFYQFLGAPKTQNRLRIPVSKLGRNGAYWHLRSNPQLI